MGRFTQWIMTKTENPYTALYDKKKGFWKNCEEVGLYRQEQRRKAKEQAKQAKQLKDFRALKKLEEK
jgi:hypothetical protein